METYCLSCKKNTADKNPNVRKTKQNRLMVLKIVLFVATKNRLSLKMENFIKQYSKISRIFEIISLK